MLNLVEQSDLDEIKAKLAELVSSYEFLTQRCNSLEKRIAALEFPSTKFGPLNPAPDPYRPWYQSPYVQPCTTPGTSPGVWCSSAAYPDED